MALPKILALVMIVSTMFGAGLEIDLHRLGESLRNYGLLARALLANFVLMPLFAFLLVRYFNVDRDASIGILLMAMAPGVPFLVNSAGRKQGGSLSFALEIAFLFSTLSVITIPITASLVFPPDVLANVPASHFLVTLLAFQLVPLIAGALAAPHISDALAAKTARVLHLVFLAAALVLLVLVFPKIVSSVMSVYGEGKLLVIAAIGIFALGIGWLLGGPDRQYRRTLSVATDLRNVGLCVLIGTSDFADTLVVPTILSYFIITFVLSLPLRIYYARTKDAAAAA